jgi:hypothetical protein
MIYMLIKDVLQRNCGRVPLGGVNITQLLVVHAELVHLYIRNSIHKTKPFSSRRERTTPVGKQTLSGCNGK